MSAPEISLVYPSNGSTAVPVGANIEITFSNGIDISTVKNFVVLYGRDNDFITGPETATFIKGGSQGDFLKSPGFKGIVQCDFDLVYIDAQGDEVSPELLNRVSEEAGPYVHKLIVSPKTILAPSVDYTVYIIGEDEEGTAKGISSRTVYDVDYSNATSTDAIVVAYGGYTGTLDDTISVKITKAGNIGTAEYKWWYSDTETESEARTGKVTSRRFRKLEDGVQIRFKGSNFIKDDVYTIECKAPELLASSLSFSFSTSTTQIQEVAETTSTTVIGTQNDPIIGYLQVVESNPPDGGTNLKFASKTIVIEFDAELNPDTVTQDTVTLLKYPVSGIINSSDEEVELFKKLTVDGNKIIIEV